MIVFIGCGSKKNNKECKAKDMYQGGYFTTCLDYARTLTNEDNIYILSAKYGVLHLEDIISPYNKTLNTATKQEYAEWKQMVLEQFNKLGITGNDEVTMLCGKNYYKELLTYFKNINLPLKDFKGMGYQISFMKSQIKPKKHIVTLFNM